MKTNDLIKQLSEAGDIAEADVVVFDDELDRYLHVVGIHLYDKTVHGKETIPAKLELVIEDNSL